MVGRTYVQGILSIALLSIQAFAAEDSAGAKKQTPAAKPSSAALKPTTSRTTSARHTASSSKKRPSRKPAYRRTAQQQPTPQRYKEIQQALADKGYFNGPADGNWGADSMDALKRFQHDQNLPEDGKIGSLSLIALGLGPKRVVVAQGASGDQATPSKAVEPHGAAQEP